MPVLINPAGRYVVIDDPAQYDDYKERRGFKIPTEQEEKDYLSQRQTTAEAVATARVTNDKTGRDIYMATVSPGGKDGYGIASQKIIDGLRKLGIGVQTHYDNQKVALLFHNPYSISQLESPYRMLYTMFESDKIPDDWIDYLQEADQVIVPSKWCKDIFAKAGCDAKVIPLGYDDKIFKYMPRENKRKMRKDFVFLHYNAFNIRKGFVEVFKAFIQEFKKDEPVKLILKTTIDNPPLPISKEQYPNIEVITGKVTEKELADICYKADCFVYPSRGEGFGMTPLEAMATGIPAIVPNAHGISEYFNADFMYEVKVKEECPALYSRYKGQDVGKMVICDVDDLAAKMRYIYEHQEEALEMGKKASEYVKYWTFDKCVENLKHEIDIALEKKIEDKPIRNVLKLEQI